MLIKDTNEKQSLIEIGGFPGRYLAYLGAKYNIKPTCLDYNSDTTEIEGVFKVMGVDDYEITQQDFTTYKTPIQYDYVISNGFIEHFEDFNTILDLHVDYMKDQSKLLVMIPNMRGYVRFYKYLVDYKNLKIHNLKCMHLKVFQDFAQRHDLKIKYLSHYGGFPIGVHQKLNVFQKLVYKSHRLLFKYIFNPYLMTHPSRFFSSSIIAIFEKQ
jgi:cyclopropane fatty-acyl-phospholipid synthase-like methyltransferase